MKNLLMTQNDIASHDDDDDNDDDNGIIEQEEEKSRTNEGIGLTSQETSDESSSKSNVESLVTEIGNAKIDDGSMEEDLPTETPMTVEEVDALLDTCMLQALHTTVKEKDLPMPGSTLW